MTKVLSAVSLAWLLAIGVVHTTGCGSDGPAEDAGEQVDKTVDKMKDKVD